MAGIEMVLDYGREGGGGDFVEGISFLFVGVG